MGFEKEKAKANADFREMTMLTPDEVRALAQKVEAAGGNDAYCIQVGALRRRNGQLFVIVKDDGTVPYVDLSRHLKQVDDYRARKQAAEDFEVERLTGINPRNERYRKFFDEMKQLAIRARINP